jgi:predicted DNA-binding transcriptional regulator AlpA
MKPTDTRPGNNRKKRAAAHAELTQSVGDPAVSGARAPPPDIELWAAEHVCAFFGGDKPIHIATLYRGIDTGRYPRPINVADNVVRWIGAECREALAQIIARRNAGERTTPRGGGRRAA